MPSRAEQLRSLGQSVWLDFIRRGHLLSGEFDRLVSEQGVVGVTSNPTIFQLAIAESDDYDDALRARAARGLAGAALFESIAVEDIQMACDRLAGTARASGGLDGRVSIEVSPRLAHDTAGTIEEARRLHRSVARENVMVKVPATAAGLPAITQLLADGICINVTLIFSLARYEQVMEAYLAGLERRVAAGQPIDALFSVASFFVSRVDGKSDKAIAARLAALPAEAPERTELKSYLGQAAIANARLAYARFEAVFGAPRFAALAARGARVQRPLWASTSTKNPAYRDVVYVEELIGDHTVNTMPPQTLTAFNDHGVVESRIHRGLDDARRLFERLPQLGVPIDALIDELEPEGVASFAKSYESLLETLEKRRREMAPAASEALDLSSAHAVLAGTTRTLDLAAFARRLAAHDDALWSDDPAHRAVARNRLGWMDAPARMQPKVAELAAFAAEARAEGFTHAVLLGMGGSSLAPEVLRLTFGVRPGSLELTVLDNTSPAAVRAVAAGNDPARTLFIVSSKSGGTIEVASFEKFFFERVRAARGEGAGRAFVAITDPGTPLERLARERGYRRVFSSPADVGGRYSALTEFGLVPAALIGVDVAALLAAAEREAASGAPEGRGVHLGAALGELARAGRDKLTLVLGDEIAALGSWIEQLIAESTGKNARGILPVADEPLADPALYGRDRVFVAVSANPLPASVESRLAALRSAGHPVIRWTIPALTALGGEFLRWEIATATAGAVLGVDPFDEPNVTEAKQATQAVLQRYLDDGALPAHPSLASGAGLEVEAPSWIADTLRRKANGGEPPAWLAALLAHARPGDYVALLAYLHRTPERHARLQRLRLACRAATRLATTLGYGPRFLHSTGQFHKGGPASGLFVQFTADEGEDLAIPGERYSFGVLRAAQAMGDYQVLGRRERRVLRIHLGRDVERSLEVLIEAVEAVRV